MTYELHSPYASSHTLHGSIHIPTEEGFLSDVNAPKAEAVMPKVATSLPPRSPTVRRNIIRGRITTPRNVQPILPRSELNSTELAFKQKQNYAHHFLDPVIRPMTWAYVKTMLTAVGFIVMLMWAAMPLYWGSLAPGQRHGPSFRTWVVDFDGGELGAFVTESVMNSTLIGTKKHLGWEIASPSSLEELTNDIVEEHAWAAIVINQGATSALQAARATGNVDYDPTSAVTLYIEEARNNNAVGTLIVPLSTSLLENTMRRFNAKNIPEYLSSISSNSTALSEVLRAHNALSGAWWKTVNLRPWDTPIATAMTAVGQIYICVFCFILTMAIFPVRVSLEPYLTNRSVMLFRVLFPAIAYIPLSLSFAMISLPFHAPFGTTYTYAGGFFLYFAYVYMDMLALGLAIEAAVSILQPRFMAYFLVPWLIVNVATPIEPHEMQVWWYKYGYGMPFFNHGEAVNTILFNTKNVLGRNAGVLIAWAALSTVTTAGLTWYRRRDQVAKYRAGLTNQASGKPE
ncbi:putative nitrosoguanidine resistance protein SNG1 [Rhizoctonia solani 123E]|uniref:Putative nitrosoguanidine resistance protein SNG1 n=1 Tax=Rhizoctonia solani 123E TaxID=1423351 RepID=A0A074S3T3_9AGAM|nr:putative nitrosoguanidine resistance protein SNG1 [Rhizoctonia solani 123E]